MLNMLKDRIKRKGKRKAALTLTAVTLVTFAFSNFENRMEIKAGQEENTQNQVQFIKFEQGEGTENEFSIGTDQTEPIWVFNYSAMDGNGNAVTFREDCKPGIYDNDHTKKAAGEQPEKIIRLIQGVKEDDSNPGMEDNTNSYTDYRSGSAMINQALQLESNKSFSAKFTMSMPDAVVNSIQTSNNYREVGGDGIAFVLTTGDSITGQSGGGMGYAGINNSVIVELDSFFNGAYATLSSDKNGFFNFGFDNQILSKGHDNGPYYTISDGLFSTVNDHVELNSKGREVMTAFLDYIEHGKWNADALNKDTYISGNNTIKKSDESDANARSSTGWSIMNMWGYKALDYGKVNRRFDHIGIMLNGEQKIHDAIYYINDIDPTHINTEYKYDNIEKTENEDASRASGRFADKGVDDRLFTFWIDYDGESDRMQVYYALGDYKTAVKPAAPCINYIVNLQEELGTTDDIHVGFTSAVGASKANHTIHSFQFKNYSEQTKAEYTIEYYKWNKENNTYEIVSQDTETKVGKLGETVGVAEADVTDKYNNYTYNPTASAGGAQPKASGTVAEGGSLVLKFYYDPISTKYTIEKYYQQSDGSFEADDNEKINGNGYVGDTVTATDNNKTTSKEGYVFDDSITGTVLSKALTDTETDNVLKLYFVKENTKYKTEYYKQQTDGTYTLAETSDWSTGKVGTDVSVPNPIKEYTGYTKVTVNSGDNVSRESIESLAFDENENIMRVYYNLNTTYKVEYYYEDEHGNFQLDSTSSNRDGVSGDTAKITDDDKTPKPGYAYDSGNSNKVEQEEIKPDGTTVLKVYFVMKDTQYKTEYYQQQTDGTYALKESTDWSTGEVGTSVSVPQPIKEYTGYTKVTVNSGDNVSKESIDSLSKDKEDNVMKVYYNKNASYKVEYYYENNEGGFDLKKTDTSRSGVSGKIVGITNDDKIPEQAEYVYDSGNDNEVAQTEIKPDGSATLKVYFVKEATHYKTEYYLQQSDGSYKIDTKESTDWQEGKVGEGVTAENKNYDGYTKVELNSGDNQSRESIDSLDEDENKNVMKVYYNLNRKYKVEYYYEDENGDFTKDSESELRESISGETVNVTEDDKTPDKDGYEYDGDNPEKIETKVITPSRDIILKVYFEKKPAQYKTEYYLQQTDGSYDKFTDSGWEDGKVGNKAVADIRTYTDYTHVTTDNTKESITALEENRDSNIMKVYYNRNAAYIVEYYYENDNGDFVKDSESTPRKDVAGNNVSVTEDDKIPKNDEYVYDADNKDIVTVAELTPDGKTVLKVYFEKKPTQYKTEYYQQQPDGSYKIVDDTGWTDGKVGKSVTAENKDYDGYTKVTVNSGDNVTRESIDSLSKDKEDNVMKVYYNKNASYKVEYYYENDEGGFDLKKTDTSRTGVSGEIVGITNNDKIPEQAEYVYDSGNDNEVAQTEIKPDGTATLKVYFVKEATHYKTEYYLQQSDGSYKIDTTASTGWKEGKVGEGVTAENKNYDGYTKVELNSGDNQSRESIDSLDEDENKNVMKVYYNLNRKYKVEYYYEDENGDFTKDSESELRESISGETVNVTENDKIPNKDGYEYDGDNPEKIETKVITPSGDIILKVYFEKKTAQYKTEYYLQQPDGSYIKDSETDWNAGKVGNKVIAENKEYDNYGLFKTKDTVDSISSLNEDRSGNIMKLYYNRKTVYIVEYWYEGDDESFKRDSVSDEREGITGSMVSVNELDKIPHKNGYKYDSGNASAVIEEIANLDGTTTLRVYFVHDDSIEPTPEKPSETDPAEPTPERPSETDPVEPTPEKPSETDQIITTIPVSTTQQSTTKSGKPVSTGDTVNKVLLIMLLVSGTTLCVFIAGKKRNNED